MQWLQEHLHLDFELSVNRFVSGISWLAQLMNYYYATLHFVVTVGVLTWLFVARKRVYRGLRTALFALTLVALVGFFVYPLAPPRLLPAYGYIDTLASITPGVRSPTRTSPSTPTSSPRCPACTSDGRCGARSR